MKCMIVRPTADIEVVADWLNENKIGYSILRDENVIFANLGEVDPALESIAEVTDPVYCRDGRWYSSDGDHESNGCDTEAEARYGFVCYISWAGEWVPNRD